MAIDYNKLSLVAQRLIDTNGQMVTFTKLGRSPANAMQPWRGPDLTGDVVVTCLAVVIPNMEKDDKEAMKRGDATAYVADLDFGAHAMEGFDTMVDSDSRTWRVLDVEIVKPGVTRVMYTVQLNH